LTFDLGGTGVRRLASNSHPLPPQSEEKFVAKLSIEGGSADLREQAKDLLAEMIAARELLAKQLTSMEDATTRAKEA
jgi:hypothetical protein